MIILVPYSSICEPCQLVEIHWFTLLPTGRCWKAKVLVTAAFGFLLSFETETADCITGFQRPDDFVEHVLSCFRSDFWKSCCDSHFTGLQRLHGSCVQNNASNLNQHAMKSGLNDTQNWKRIILICFFSSFGDWTSMYRYFHSACQDLAGPTDSHR